jgi:hypothetical protein
VIGNAWKAFESLIWLGIVTSLLCEMKKIYLYPNYGKIKFDTHKELRNFVNGGDMPKIIYKENNNFGWRTIPNTSVAILVEYKKIGGISIEFEYRFLSQRQLNLEKLLN